FRIESDAGDAAYEAHVAKADGTPVTVKFDKAGNVTKVEKGMGAGDPPCAGGPGGPPPPGRPGGPPPPGGTSGTGTGAGVSG
ncbi:MAG: hypothetical protein JO222_11925, partial [Frankiales bacterium]|nr:hypothetical protein [Frankiales bacterium]